MVKSEIAYLIGSDAHRGVTLNREGRIDSEGSTDIYGLRTANPRDYTRIHIPKNYFRQKRRHDLSGYRLFLNLVTDADENPGVLKVLKTLLKKQESRVINRPAAVLKTGRDAIARLAPKLPGLAMPKTIRLATAKPNIAAGILAREGIVFPAMLRRAGTHTGQFAGLFGTAEALLAALEPGGDHYVTEFRDFASGDGLYRKFRVFCIGEATILRHMLISDSWNVHASARTGFMADRSALIAEERERMAAGAAGLPEQVREGIAALRRALGLDFFGMDFALDGEGRALLFEANATMNFFPFPDDERFAYSKSCLAPAQAAFDGLIRG